MVAVIAGIDAGATCAYALISLEGKVVRIGSRKDAGQKYLFEALASASPVFIACDTNPPSATAKKLKQAFGCRLFVPRKSLGVLEKEIMCRDYKVANHHERDALSAAIKCYNAASGKLRQLDRRIRTKRRELEFEPTAKRMLSGESVHDIGKPEKKSGQ